MSWQTKLSASLPTTWKLGKFLNDTKHHKMLHISFSPEKYQVRSSLLCYMNSEKPRTRLRFSSNRLIWEFYFLAGIIYWYYLHHFLHIKLLSMVSYGNILKSDNHHFITHMLLHWLPLLYLATRQAGGLDISNVNQAEIQAATQPVWISHLPGLFSDAQIGLLITDFLLLFVNCCVVRAWGVCKIMCL